MSEHDGNEIDGARTARWPWRALTLLALLGVAALLGALLSGGHSSSSTLPGGAREAGPGSGYEGTLTLPREKAPAIDLRNYSGQPVTLARYRGKAVFVTFLYAHCPDVCPLIASNLGVAMNMLGARAKDAQLIAVSVDPRGDTAKTVARFVREHGLTGRIQYLIGNASELARTWAAWKVGSKRDAGRPELVSHDALVYGVSGKGLLTTVYPADFEPAEIAHDAPKLAAG